MKKWLKRLGLVAGGILVALVLIEIGLRLWGFHYAFVGRRDPIKGWANVPNAETIYATEGRANIRINSHGFRDVERTRAKPSGVYRIAVLGDSYAEAMQVELQDTFCSQLERLLNQKDRAVEVLPFGVGGYGTGQEYLMLEHDVLAFEPDMVLLAFLSGNDVLDNSRKLDPAQTRFIRPYYYFDGNELLLDRSRAVPKSPVATANRNAVASIRLLQFIEYIREHHKQRLRQDAARRNVDLINTVYEEPRGEWVDAWRVTDRLIADMNALCRRHGVEFRVVTLTNPQQVHPDRSQREAVMKRHGVADLFYPDRRIAALGKANDFRVLNLAQPMQQEADATGVYFHGFSNARLGGGHWNQAGHRFAAEQLAPWLAEAIGPAAGSK